MGNNWEVIGWGCKRDNIFKNWLGEGGGLDQLLAAISKH